MIHRFLCVALALIALVATSFLLHTLLPPVIPAGVAAKLKFFNEHKDEFDTLFLGTSRFYYAVSPEIFDKTTRENGVPTRTFNFGVDGMHPPENFYVLEQILKTKPRNLKWVFLEIGDVQTGWAGKELGTRRVVYWHDWARTALTLKKALNPRGGAPWYIKATRLWLARRALTQNMTLFAKQFANIGRVADFFSSEDENQHADRSDSELGPKHDGYRLAGSAMSAERAAIFKKNLGQEVSNARPKFIDPYADQAYRDAATQIHQIGAAPFFVVTPIIFQSRFNFRRLPPGPLLSFNDSKVYPELYDTNVRIDDGHLTRQGSETFTGILAHEFIRTVRLVIVQP